MTAKEFLSKFKSKYLWINFTAMFGVVVVLCLGVKFGIEIYTHHGEAIPIPNVLHKNFDDAERILDDVGLKVVVTDTGYVKSLPPDCILEQSPKAGEKVKSGHVIYVTINSNHSPMVTIPDVIDNSSLREAMAKLSAMGFKLGQPKFITGEQDWVYGITVKGRNVSTGDKVSIEETLTIIVGNGQRSNSDSVDYVEPEMNEQDEMEEVPDNATEQDEFEEVKENESAHGE